MACQKFPSLPWDQVIDRVANSVFCISVDDFAGSSFVVSLAKDDASGTFHTILATAWHVLRDVENPEQKLRITSWDGTRTFVAGDSRTEVIRLGSDVFDTALIHIETKEPTLDIADLLPLFPSDSVLARGAGVGWLGFPTIADPELCFFRGCISGYLNDPPAYLVDGVAINGVSGGPVFDDRCHLVGLVSAYIPNRLDDQTLLQGLSSITPINAIRYWLDNKVNAHDLSRAD